MPLRFTSTTGPQLYSLQNMNSGIRVIQYDSNGVLFLKKKGGVLGNRDTVFFRYDEISAVVDSQKFCVWGKLAERDITKMELTFSLRNLDDSTYQPLEIILNKDKHFAFCAKPGKYELSSIKMTKADEDRDYYFLSIYSPLGSFEIKSGKANYIGEITVLTYDTTNNISFRVPYKKYSKQGTYIPYYSGVSPAATIIGTAVAVAIYAAIELNKTPETNLPELKFHVEHSPLFQSFSKSNIENTLLLIPE
ncbi:MAG: hypothetical protein HYV28_01840 [Ignavibacteriales bacterium]|nr:hypothetical protein [Ignavibacteriales bacterium]